MEALFPILIPVHVRLKNPTNYGSIRNASQQPSALRRRSRDHVHKLRPTALHSRPVWLWLVCLFILCSSLHRPRFLQWPSQRCSKWQYTTSKVKSSQNEIPHAQSRRTNPKTLARKEKPQGNLLLLDRLRHHPHRHRRWCRPELFPVQERPIGQTTPLSRL